MRLLNKVLIAGFIISTLFSMLGFGANSERLSEEIIRLHVKANSNSDEDQEIKLIVKDAINVYVGSILSDDLSLEESQMKIKENITEIENIANNTLKSLGSSDIAKAEFGVSYFPTRYYESFTLPAGDYLALTVNIGEAEGENWWCVLYPSLCTSSSVDGKLGETEEAIITETPEISFKIYELYLDLLNFFEGFGDKVFEEDENI